MINIHVPWPTVGLGTEVVGPLGDLWTVTRIAAGTAEVERDHEVKTVTFGSASMCTVALRDLDEAVLLIENAIPGAREIARANGLGEWFVPIELAGDQLRAHLHAFHNEPAGGEQVAATSAAYAWHANQHRLQPPIGVPHAHV